MNHAHGYPGLFLVIEGAHGSGKTTQARLLAQWLCAEGYQVQLTREVGGTELGDRLRELISDPRYAPTLEAAPKSLLFLVLAARSAHLKTIIQPALAAGKIVVCERFDGSTYAFQHYANGLEWTEISEMHRFASEGIAPDLTILLDVPAQLGLARKQHQGISGFWDMRPLEYQERIVEGYREAVRRLPKWIVIDAKQEVEVVFEDVCRTVRVVLPKPL